MASPRRRLKGAATGGSMGPQRGAQPWEKKVHMQQKHHIHQAVGFHHSDCCSTRSTVEHMSERDQSAEEQSF